MFLFWYQVGWNLLREIVNINQIKIIGQRPSFFTKWRLKSAVQIVYLSQLKDVTQSKKKYIHLSPCKNLIKNDDFITKETLP